MEKDFESIAIRDITQRAHGGYATFFRHYTSKEDLIADAFQESVSHLRSPLQAMGELDAQMIITPVERLLHA
ncbi:MAG TPA: TetR family transcriptional regulator [Anaerolineae bacterium]|nr:TetR family transcriptional regulator [Anaerolineae bacterium]